MKIINLTKLILTLIIVLSLTHISLAIAISPGAADIDFSPSYEKNITFTVINNELEQTSFVFGLRGDLPQYIKLPFINFTLTPNEERTITSTIVYPSKLEPGKYVTRIQILSVQPSEIENKNTIKTIVGLEFLINTNVAGTPTAKKEYRGTLIGPQLEILSVTMNSLSANEKEINAEIGNFGDASAAAYADVDIISSSNNLIKNSKTITKEFLPLSKDNLKTNFNAKDLSGKYSVQLSLHYGNKTITQITGMNALTQKQLNLNSNIVFAVLIIAIALNMILAIIIAYKIRKR